MQYTDMDHNPLLFGHSSTPAIVAIEPAGRFVRLFCRSGREVCFHDVPFQPFILVDSPVRVTGCKVPATVRQLQGDEPYRYQLLYESWGECLAARDFLATATAKPAGAADAPYLFIQDLAHQFMLSSGDTQFKSMEFTDLRCLALDIETFCAEGYEFSNPERPEDRIISIALKDSHGEEYLLRGDQLSEKELLLALNDIIHRCDPDVITGHNIFRFDLDYLGKRARQQGVSLNWGRNGATPHITQSSRWSLAGKAIDYPRWDVYGRHIIDTYFLIQLFDIGTRTLANHGLKYVARHFGITADTRVYLDGENISHTFLTAPQQLFNYNLDDVRETLALFRLLAYPWFLQTRMFPYSFQNCPLRGPATRINALFLRQYLHQGHAIPLRTPLVQPFEGGYTELSRQGIFGPVVHCDVASLYPSLMLTYRLSPAKDSLGLFLPMLAELRTFRLKAKQSARDATTEAERNHFESLQQVFKLLINSFFGYLGAAQHNFSDPDTAAEVTRLGRVTIKNMLEMLLHEGGEVLEVDTDGIYFRPPPDCVTLEQETALVRKISDGLPTGIDVEHDGRFCSMFTYKTKNYALLTYDDTITIKGSSLKSRGIERYLREFMQEMIRMLLHNQSARVENLYAEYVARLRSRTFAIDWIARTETLNESPHSYQEKILLGKRTRSAAFEIALAAERSYRAGDQVSYYVSGLAKDVVVYEACRSLSAFNPAHFDINIAYYVEKLRHLKQRFVEFLPKEPTLFDL